MKEVMAEVARLSNSYSLIELRESAIEAKAETLETNLVHIYALQLL